MRMCLPCDWSMLSSTPLPPPSPSQPPLPVLTAHVCLPCLVCVYVMTLVLRRQRRWRGWKSSIWIKLLEFPVLRHVTRIKLRWQMARQLGGGLFGRSKQGHRLHLNPATLLHSHSSESSWTQKAQYTVLPTEKQRWIANIAEISTCPWGYRDLDEPNVSSDYWLDAFFPRVWLLSSHNPLHHDRWHRCSDRQPCSALLRGVEPQKDCVLVPSTTLLCFGSPVNSLCICWELRE